MLLVLIRGNADPVPGDAWPSAVPLAGVVLTRRLGACDHWEAEPESPGDLDALAAAAFESPADTWRVWRVALPPVPVSPLLVRGPSTRDGSVGFVPVRPDDLIACRAVTGFQHLNALLRLFPTADADQEAQTALEAVTTTPGGQFPAGPGGGVAGTIFQHHTTLREQLTLLVAAWNRVCHESPLCVAYRPTPDDAGWSVRTCRAGATGFQLDLSGTWKAGAVACAPWAAWPDAPTAGVRRISSEWDAAEWATDLAAPLPHAAQLGTEWAVLFKRTDTLSVGLGGKKDILNWTATGGAGVPKGAPAGPARDAVWWWGTVQQAGAAKATVHLDGYPPGADGDASCVLVTPSSGTGDAPGVHAPPYPNSRGLVLLPLHPFAAYPLFLGNPRLPGGPTDPTVAFPEHLFLRGGEKLTARGGDARIEATQQRVDVFTRGANDRKAGEKKVGEKKDSTKKGPAVQSKTPGKDAAAPPGAAPAVRPAEPPEDELLPVLDFIVAEMNTNAAGEIVRNLRTLNATPDECSGPAPGWDWWPELFGNLTTPAKCAAAKLTNRVAALRKWAGQVGPGKIWDHKKPIWNLIHPRKISVGKAGAWVHRYQQNEFNFDIWSNVHYGFVGLAAGFGEDMLLRGGGLAQLWSRVKDLNWDLGPDPDKWKALDDPADQAAIRLGFRLFKANPSAVTRAALLVEALADAGLNKYPYAPPGASGK